jgi:hypothetical protein
MADTAVAMLSDADRGSGDVAARFESSNEWEPQ